MGFTSDKKQDPHPDSRYNQDPEQLPIWYMTEKNFMQFAYRVPSKIKILSKKLRVDFVYLEKSFDTIFNMGYGGGPSP